MIWPGMPSTKAAIEALERAGYHVEPEDLPGLYRINGGPELTAGQLEDVAGRLANVGKT